MYSTCIIYPIWVTMVYVFSIHGRHIERLHAFSRTVRKYGNNAEKTTRAVYAQSGTFLWKNHEKVIFCNVYRDMSSYR